MFMLTKMGIEPIKHPASAIFLCVCVCVRGSVAKQLGCWTSNQQKKRKRIYIAPLLKYLTLKALRYG